MYNSQYTWYINLLACLHGGRAWLVEYGVGGTEVYYFFEYVVMVRVCIFGLGNACIFHIGIFL